jgi:hypothetical protein
VSGMPSFFPIVMREAHPHLVFVMAGYCSAGFCSDTQILGRLCATDVDCTNSGLDSDVQISCSPDGICGEGRAQCDPDWWSPIEIGESSACISGMP